MAKCIMIQGTMSGAGKSLLVTALCRIFREDGYRVAPFKSQNMALNSYITKDGLEMGRAQVAQAEAAGKEPDVRMNPILLKPTSDVGSQVIVNGRVIGTYRAAEYFKMKTTLIPDILHAYKSLAEENDIIVIEGAGSPAEINLKADDIVNMGLAKLVDAPVLLVGDINPGGVFAQLYGTIALLEEDERARIAGTVINKFRGDVEILKPGLKMLEELTRVPCLGVVPYTDADIDDEDSLSSRLLASSHEKVIDIAVIRLPRISNFTDFAPLEEHPALGIRYVNRREELGNPDMIILPGTKSTMADLRWLRESGLEALILKKADAGTPVLGVCGGYQMLGVSIKDPEGVESGQSSGVVGGCQMNGESIKDSEGVESIQSSGVLDGCQMNGVSIKDSEGVESIQPKSKEASYPSELPGMGLLPVSTIFSAEKCRTRVQGLVIGGPLEGVHLDGYEIHMGRTKQISGKGSSFIRLEDGRMDGCCCGNVFGTYLHGLFDTGELTDAVAEYLLERKGINPENFHAESRAEYRERQYRKLAETVRESLDMSEIYRIIGLRVG